MDCTVIKGNYFLFIQELISHNITWEGFSKQEPSRYLKTIFSYGLRNRTKSMILDGDSGWCIINNGKSLSLKTEGKYSHMEAEIKLWNSQSRKLQDWLLLVKKRELVSFNYILLKPGGGDCLKKKNQERVGWGREEKQNLCSFLISTLPTCPTGCKYSGSFTVTLFFS